MRWQSRPSLCFGSVGESLPERSSSAYIVPEPWQRPFHCAQDHASHPTDPTGDPTSRSSRLRLMECLECSRADGMLHQTDDRSGGRSRCGTTANNWLSLPLLLD